MFVSINRKIVLFKWIVYFLNEDMNTNVLSCISITSFLLLFMCMRVWDCACVRACVSSVNYLSQKATMKIRYVRVLFDQMYTCMSICATFYE